MEHPWGFAVLEPSPSYRLANRGVAGRSWEPTCHLPVLSLQLVHTCNPVVFHDAKKGWKDQPGLCLHSTKKETEAQTGDVTYPQGHKASEHQHASTTTNTFPAAEPLPPSNKGSQNPCLSHTHTHSSWSRSASGGLRTPLPGPPLSTHTPTQPLRDTQGVQGWAYRREASQKVRGREKVGKEAKMGKGWER